MHDDNAKLNISAEQARRFALSFYNTVSKYCAENYEQYLSWENAQTLIIEGDKKDEKTT